MLRARVVLPLVTVFLLCLIVSAQQTSPSTTVPNLIRYDAVLSDAQSAAVHSLQAEMTFSIYNQQEGGSPLWTESQSVIADASGAYSVLLGATSKSGLPWELFADGQPRW